MPFARPSFLHWYRAVNTIRARKKAPQQKPIIIPIRSAIERCGWLASHSNSYLSMIVRRSCKCSCARNSPICLRFFLVRRVCVFAAALALSLSISMWLSRTHARSLAVDIAHRWRALLFASLLRATHLCVCVKMCQFVWVVFSVIYCHCLSGERSAHFSLAVNREFLRKRRRVDKLIPSKITRRRKVNERKGQKKR